eukprot:CAMPEP_0172528178 /NCGR_PEP_ID=MMETSP1067-20121228/2647_1 /TAXON_ID=265564 ORGANISM="Thalassiosira punctigera, Strain Tpunct2005C2" /NCGR_SAMPLE_ID=MMETSP1067 /ASSEMBLY_ACC=CAM_ASM_000444 /LENGTH=521 /DNA_ID=CAMNT_0013312049 /DNA_START=366 /DNA_END=1931 /DNA_ORIENTATION=+
MLYMHSSSIAEQHSSFSSGSDDESLINIEYSNLVDMIRASYDSGETDGVQRALLSTETQKNLSADLPTEEVAKKLVGAAIEAAGTDRGRLAAIINAIIASCCGDDEDDDSIVSSKTYPQIALDILDIIDEMHAMDAAAMISPDIVSLSLVYYSLDQSQQHDAQEFGSESRIILERAQRLAKKMAGSQRRKALAAERRRGGKSNRIDAKEVESQLQSLYGQDIHILKETKDVIIISKPAGMVTYHTKKTTAGVITSSRKKKRRSANANNSDADKNGAKQMDISLVDALLDFPISLSTLNPVARGIVHRLDRGTSGAIVLAKTDEIHLKLVALFFLRRTKKKYLSLVPGCEADIDMNMGDSVDLDNDPLQFTIGSTGVIDVPVDGRPAQSSYKVVKVFGKQQQSSMPEALLLEIETLTGRKHQVRVHCASLGRPIFLDPLYSSSAQDEKSKIKGKRRQKNCSTFSEEESAPNVPKAISDLLENSNDQHERFFLHAKSLSIPEVGISVNAPLPVWWFETIDHWD